MRNRDLTSTNFLFMLILRVEYALLYKYLMLHQLFFCDRSIILKYLFIPPLTLHSASPDRMLSILDKNQCIALIFLNSDNYYETFYKKYLFQQIHVNSFLCRSSNSIVERNGKEEPFSHLMVTEVALIIPYLLKTLQFHFINLKKRNYVLLLFNLL